VRKGDMPYDEENADLTGPQKQKLTTEAQRGGATTKRSTTKVTKVAQRKNQLD
jgi:hypothetical protein